MEFSGNNRKAKNESGRTRNQKKNWGHPANNYCSDRYIYFTSPVELRILIIRTSMITINYFWWEKRKLAKSKIIVGYFFMHNITHTHTHSHTLSIASHGLTLRGWYFDIFRVTGSISHPRNMLCIIELMSWRLGWSIVGNAEWTKDSLKSYARVFICT